MKVIYDRFKSLGLGDQKKSSGIDRNDRINIQNHTIDIFDKLFKYEVSLPVTDTTDHDDNNNNKKIVELDLKKIEQEISKTKCYHNGTRIARRIVKEKQVPPKEIDLAVEHRAKFEKHPNQHTHEET